MSDQLNIAELQKLAEAAMQPSGNMVPPHEAILRSMSTMQAFRIAANPQSILSLVERIKELEATLKHAQEMTAVEAVVAVKWQRKSDELEKQNAELRDAITNLIKVKGRFHTEQAYQRLVAVYDAATNQGGQENG